MPWKELSRMNERERMIQKSASGLYNISELAREFGVSRATIYKWISRYEEDPLKGLEDRPPIPKTIQHRTPPEIVEELIETKRLHPDWGPDKLVKFLRREQPEISWPATSTASDHLKAVGMVQSRRRTRTIETWSLKTLDITDPSEAMTADHKGQFRLGNSMYCYPLTLANPHSRYVYAVDSLSSTSYAEAQPVFERVFKEHGIPRWMLTDNGGPFCCSQALCGLTRLGVWWIKMGVQPVRIKKGAPWQNGIHERMHRTLKASTTRPPSEDSATQQERFDRFRTEFNHVRPHSSLDDQSPIAVYKAFSRAYQHAPKRVEYPGHYETRSVRTKGSVRWKGSEIFLSEALAGEIVGFEEIDDGTWSLHYAHIELARFDERKQKLI